jgi:DNA-binding response OmpR family regulator
VQVTDNGIGIPKHHIPKLFTTYYQVRNGDTHHAGYGLGLALAKSLVLLHQGTLTVESREATAQLRGSTRFTVSLPTGNTHLPAKPVDTTFRHQTTPMPATAGLPEGRREKEVILLAEDNTELRDFIRESLEGRYTVLEAENGDQGLGTAFEEIPDLVISDIMMPGTNGLQVCHTLKTDERTNHIPVILLTARTAHEQQVEGLQTGADAYITKPFSIQVLELQITNLLASRAAMRKRYAHQVTLQPSNIDIRNADEEFLNKAIEAIEAHMEDNDFGVAMLSTKLAMSQPVLYKKLKALTDMSVNDFVKSIKLKKAAALLLQRQHTVNEIAYMVGFNDRKYFSREFRKQFGKTPSEYASGQADSE